jgi:hypothetical protein
MAFFRALESVRSPKQRLFLDPLACHFLNPRLRVMTGLAHFPPFRMLLNRYVDLRVHRNFFGTPHLFPGAPRLKRDLERLEEPWTFGLDPAEIPLLLRRYGLRLMKDREFK